MRRTALLSALAVVAASDMVIMQEAHQDNRHWRRLSRVDGFVPHEIVLATKVRDQPIRPRTYSYRQ